MPGTVLITGGAGFIGRRVAAALLARGWRVRVLDALIPQVHPGRAPPPDLGADVELLIGDVRDPEALGRALAGVDDVIHLAAEVGVGQSMYAVERYVSVNDVGAAALIQRAVERPVRRIVVASSMSVYGEGLYRDADGRLVEDVVRGPRAGATWDPLDAAGRPLVPVATPETKRPVLASVYALSKFVQERLALMLTAAYGVEGVALRLFNVYGPGQALSNPYTGVLANFAARLLHGRPPLVFEDGGQRRDFVHVDDAAEAFARALERPDAAGQVFNIGAGRVRTIAEVARLLAAAMGREDLEPEFAGAGRKGDVRHCFGDLRRARDALGFAARRDLAETLPELVDWVGRQSAVDRVAEARRELEARGLVA